MVFQKKKCKDHLGNKYNSISEMCKAYGIKETTYCKRLERGFTLEEALTRDVKTSRGRHYKKCKDHLGNEYNSITEMCDVYGIKSRTYKDRIYQGLTVEEALTKEVKHTRDRNCKKCKDHLGNEYDSITDMCDAYGLTIHLFHSRLKYKWSLEEALTTPKYGDKITKDRCSAKKCKDHLGNEYDSISEMCDVVWY